MSEFELWAIVCPKCHADPETVFIGLRAGRGWLIEQDCPCSLPASVVRELVRRVASRAA
jgi:hypothetical protein